MSKEKMSKEKMSKEKMSKEKMSKEKISIGFVGGEGYTFIACGRYFKNHEEVVTEAKKHLVSSYANVLHFEPKEFPILIFKINQD
jgi:hypothetical protein